MNHPRVTIRIRDGRGQLAIQLTDNSPYALSHALAASAKHVLEQIPAAWLKEKSWIYPTTLSIEISQGYVPEGE